MEVALFCPTTAEQRLQFQLLCEEFSLRKPSTFAKDGDHGVAIVASTESLDVLVARVREVLDEDVPCIRRTYVDGSAEVTAETPTEPFPHEGPSSASSSAEETEADESLSEETGPEETGTEEAGTEEAGTEETGTEETGTDDSSPTVETEAVSSTRLCSTEESEADGLPRQPSIEGTEANISLHDEPSVEGSEAGDNSLVLSPVQPEVLSEIFAAPTSPLFVEEKDLERSRSIVCSEGQSEPVWEIEPSSQPMKNCASTPRHQQDRTEPLPGNDPFWSLLTPWPWIMALVVVIFSHVVVYLYF